MSRPRRQSSASRTVAERASNVPRNNTSELRASSVEMSCSLSGTTSVASCLNCAVAFWS